MRYFARPNLKSQTPPARSPISFQGRFTGRFVKSLRWLAVLTVLSFAGSAWAVALIERNLERSVARVGGTLLDALAPRLALTENRKFVTSPPTVVTVNGATVRIQTGSLDANQVSLTHFLRRAEQECVARSSREEPSPGDTILPPPLFHAENDTDGYVACLKPAFPLTPERLAHWVRQSAAAGNLSSLGTYQGVYVRKEGEHLVVVSAELLDGLHLSEMFPPLGDCSGSDFSELPRPKGRRTLSIASTSKTGLTAYSSNLPAGRAVQDFLRGLPPHLKVREFTSGSGGASPTTDRGTAALLQNSQSTFIVSASGSDTESTLVIARVPD